MVQVDDEATVPPLRLSAPVPGTAVGVPPHVFDNPLGLATASPDGSVSLNARPVRGIEFGFVIVNVTGIVSPWLIVLDPKVFVKVGVCGLWGETVSWFETASCAASTWFASPPP